MVTGGSRSDLGRMRSKEDSTLETLSFLTNDAAGDGDVTRVTDVGRDVGDSLSEFLGEIKSLVLRPHKFVGTDVHCVRTTQMLPPFPPPLPLPVDEGAPEIDRDLAPPPPPLARPKHPQNKKSGAVKWEGNAMALSFALQIVPVKPFAHSTCLVVKYDVRDEVMCVCARVYTHTHTHTHTHTCTHTHTGTHSETRQ